MFKMGELTASVRVPTTLTVDGEEHEIEIGLRRLDADGVDEMRDMVATAADLAAKLGENGMTQTEVIAAQRASQQKMLEIVTGTYGVEAPDGKEVGERAKPLEACLAMPEFRSAVVAAFSDYYLRGATRRKNS